MSRRKIVAEFWKPEKGPLELHSLTVLERVTRHDGKPGTSRTGYDVNHSKRYGYLFHMSSGGGSTEIEASGIYFSSGNPKVKEMPVQYVDTNDEPPWEGTGTVAIRKRNRTRRLLKLPAEFKVARGKDLMDWLENNSIQDDAVWCNECQDELPGGELCEHCWWCDATGMYSTPNERCGCGDREECANDR